MFRLVTEAWGAEFDQAVKAKASRLRVICPFIKAPTARRLLAKGAPADLKVLTRFELEGFARGVSDLAALRLFIESGGQVRGVRGLHAKLYLFGHDLVIATSANLTEAAMLRNYEFGFVAREAAIFASCDSYFEQLWKVAGPNLTVADLEEWAQLLARHRGERAVVSSALPDFGAVIQAPHPFLDGGVGAPTPNQAFLKFFGESSRRAPRSMPIVEVVGSGGCSWACTYPTTVPPRQVRDGDLIFMGRLVTGPNDTLIFGRAIGLAHRDDVDLASEEEIRERPWKTKWQRYVRVRDAEFIAGTLADGVSLKEMMSELGPHTFASTERNLNRPGENTDPRKAMMQKAHMQLSEAARAWLTERLEAAFAQHGRLDPNDPALDIVPEHERKRRADDAELARAAI